MHDSSIFSKGSVLIALCVHGLCQVYCRQMGSRKKMYCQFKLNHDSCPGTGGAWANAAAAEAGMYKKRFGRKSGSLIHLLVLQVPSWQVSN